MNLTGEAPPPPQPDSPPELLPASKEGLVKFAVEAHKHFDNFIWPQHPQAQVTSDNGKLSAPSYHNHNHIDAMIQTTRALISACKTEQDPKQDPFKLKEQLDIWNDQHPDQVRLTLEDLETAFEIASAGHDLGNITKSTSVAEHNGTLTLDFSDKYEALAGTPDIEKRSADITEKLIDHYFTPEEKAKIDRLKPLIRHLIMQTVFNPQITASEESFWQFMQYTDQIGTYFFQSQPRNQTIAGLLNEMRVRSNPPPNFSQFLKFPETRASALVTDVNLRIEIEKIMMDAGGNSSNLNSEGLIGNTNRPVDYLPDITALIASH